ncbi:MAG: hypothetical protein ABIC40_04175 [bacterium]
MKTKNIITIAISLMVWGLLAIPAMATPTHTCITPNADITPEMNVVVYGWGEWGANRFDDGHFAGISLGLFDIIEVGGSYRLTKDSEFRMDPTFDAKAHYKFNDNITIAAGAYNFSGDEDKNGSMVPYGVLCYDFGGLRANVGFAAREKEKIDEVNPATGVPYTWKEWAEKYPNYPGVIAASGLFVGFDTKAGDATLKMDWTQINQGDDWRTAFGFDVPIEILIDGWTVGSWLVFSSNDQIPDTWILELSYAYPF